jgi:hypothetical protein
MGLALISAAGRLVVWLPDDVPACRGLAVVWLVRGVNASDPESGMPAADPLSLVMWWGAADGSGDDRG